MTLSFVDIHGLGGGLSLGAARAGWRMVHRAGLSFGKKSVQANRDHFEGSFTEAYDDDNNENLWALDDVGQVDAVFGVPPCSGFSPISAREYRGVDSPANACMWSLIRGAAKVEPAVVVFESVQPAFTQGRPLMQALRAELEERTGIQYGLWHVKHNALNVGGAANRARYFFVASAVPFGVDRTPIDRVPSVLESIGDLRSLAIQWEAQPYWSDGTWFSEPYRDYKLGVDGHMTRDSIHARRMASLHDEIHWEPGKDEAWAIQQAWNKMEKQLPEVWAENGRLEKVAAKLNALREGEDLNIGFNGSFRWRPTRTAYVTTGDAANKIIHPTEPRLLTARELARVIGFPDTWKIEPLRNDSKQWSYWGKCVSVPCGEWIAGWAAAAIEGSPGDDTGELIGDREWLIDHNKLHKPALDRLLAETEQA